LELRGRGAFRAALLWKTLWKLATCCRPKEKSTNSKF
jgi:hypothetical protein